MLWSIDARKLYSQRPLTLARHLTQLHSRALEEHYAKMVFRVQVVPVPGTINGINGDKLSGFVDDKDETLRNQLTIA